MIMGLAIPVVTHYTGMAAVTFIPMNPARDFSDALIYLFLATPP